ncbi:MAG: hypothetical protein IJH12_06240 [Clostridia bacterium]|nr:hypothetical protein [Clostridia bacterium]
MKKFIKSIISIGVLLSIMITLSPSIVMAAPSAPPSGGKPGEQSEGSGAPGGSNSSDVTHTGATTISSDTTNSGSTYSSTTGSESALLVTGGTSTITNAIVTKSGDSYITSLENELDDNINNWL